MSEVQLGTRVLAHIHLGLHTLELDLESLAIDGAVVVDRLLTLVAEVAGMAAAAACSQPKLSLVAEDLEAAAIAAGIAVRALQLGDAR